MLLRYTVRYHEYEYILQFGNNLYSEQPVVILYKVEINVPSVTTKNFILRRFSVFCNMFRPTLILQVSQLCLEYVREGGKG